jgi:hypothetical protein
VLWRTLLAYLLPAFHPGLRPVRDGGGEEFRPKVDEWGKRVEEGDWASVWEGYRADKIRERNRALVRPYMGAYIRRWTVLAAGLWGVGQLLGGLGLSIAAWVAVAAAAAALVVAVLLTLLRQEMQP